MSHEDDLELANARSVVVVCQGQGREGRIADAYQGQGRLVEKGVKPQRRKVQLKDLTDGAKDFNREVILSASCMLASSGNRGHRRC